MKGIKEHKELPLIICAVAALWFLKQFFLNGFYKAVKARNRLLSFTA